MLDEFTQGLIADKERIDALYVASIYSDINLYHKFPVDSKMLLGSNTSLKPFKLFYGIAERMIHDGYTTLDAISVDSYVQSKLTEATQKKYNEYGGFETILKVSELVSTDNIDKYYDDVLKYSALLRLEGKGISIQKHWAHIKPLNYKELSDYISGEYSEVFADVELGGDEVVDIVSDIDKMLSEADKGALNGIPYGSKILTAYTHGMRRGEMAILAARSGHGKTFLTTNIVLPELIKHRQRALIICNEEDIAKWQREMLTYVINNVIIKTHPDFKSFPKFSKQRFFEGRFTKQEWALLNTAKEYMENDIAEGYVLFVNLTTFSMDKAIDIIKQYSSKYGVRYYILDTLKLDNDIGSKSAGDNSWLQLQQSSVKLFNTIKSSNRDSYVLLTYQLNKQNVRKLTMESLGMSKNIVDVASTVILARNLLEEEKDKDKLKVTDASGEQVKLQEDYEYMILALEKNRAGASGREFVLRTDKAHNIIRDVGTTFVPSDR